MSEEVDYAEMLEIPVSTVNVVKKRGRRRREDIREQVIDRVNERTEEEGRSAENRVVEDAYVRRSGFFSLEGVDRRSSIILISEFAAACILCITIFLTNVFLDNSAINTFLGSFFSEGEKIDERAYSDFTLNGIVSEYSDVDVLSSGGVLSFTGESCVYPVCEGRVSSVTENGGKYTLTLAHSASFESVITGLDAVYYKEGDQVKGNIPVGYSEGEGEVSVRLYDNDSLLSCYSLDEANSLSWKS